MAKLAILLLLVAASVGCRISRVVPPGEYLLQKNKVKGNLELSTSALKEQIRHKPNRKLLFFKFHLWMYHLGFKKIGEPPVLLDSTAVDRSAANINLYLFKKGFTANEVGFEIKKSKLRRRARVTYQIHEGRRMIIDRIELKGVNKPVVKLAQSRIGKSYLKKGNPVDYDVLAEERNRINNHLREQGYYQFNRALVEFELDTTPGVDKTVILILILEDPSRPQKPFRIGNILTEIETGKDNTDTIHLPSASYVLNGMPLQTEVLERSTLLKPGNLYRQSEVSATYEKMINLGLFSSVDVRLNPVLEGDTGLIDVYIRLVAAPRHDLIWEPQLVSTEQRIREDLSSRNYGLANEITLKNKNVFGSGEEFNIRLRTALETQFARDSNSAFSTFLQEVNTELKVPHLLFASGLAERTASRSNSTRLNLSYLYERNPFYQRHLLPLSYSYEFVLNQGLFYWTPFQISLNKATFDPKVLANVDPAYLEAQKRLFTNNLITSQKISGVFSNRHRSPSEFWHLNSNFLEMAGAVLPLLTNYGETFGVNHSTFLRSDADVRYTHHINANHTVVARIFGGVGVPVGSQSILPFERRFFAGGSNSLRGWRLRTVGPGSFSNDSASIQFARSGEIGLAGNFEYRFGIIEAAVDLEGAVFFDAGNVWNWDSTLAGGQFRLKSFYREFAVNTGPGLRLDFDFLILRLDLGLPLWDPNELEGERWVFTKPWKDDWIKNRATWNLAIGYPF